MDGRDSGTNVAAAELLESLSGCLGMLMLLWPSASLGSRR